MNTVRCRFVYQGWAAVGGLTTKLLGVSVFIAVGCAWMLVRLEG